MIFINFLTGWFSQESKKATESRKWSRKSVWNCWKKLWRNRTLWLKSYWRDWIENGTISTKKTLKMVCYVPIFSNHFILMGFIENRKLLKNPKNFLQQVVSGQFTDFWSNKTWHFWGRFGHDNALSILTTNKRVLRKQLHDLVSITKERCGDEHFRYQIW